VFENKILRRIFGTERVEVVRNGGRFHNEELHNQYTSPNIIRVIKSRLICWMEHVEYLEEMRNVYKF